MVYCLGKSGIFRQTKGKLHKLGLLECSLRFCIGLLILSTPSFIMPTTPTTKKGSHPLPTPQSARQQRSYGLLCSQDAEINSQRTKADARSVIKNRIRQQLGVLAESSRPTNIPPHNSKCSPKIALNLGLTNYRDAGTWYHVVSILYRPNFKSFHTHIMLHTVPNAL